jgi:hypothetical protein
LLIPKAKELQARNSLEQLKDHIVIHPIHLPSLREASCRPSIRPHPNLQDRQKFSEILRAYKNTIVRKGIPVQDRERSPIRLLPPQMLVTNDICDLSIDLVLPHIRLFGINQNVPSIFDPDGVAKSGWKFDKHDLLIWQRARIQAISFSLDHTRNGLCSC